MSAVQAPGEAAPGMPADITRGRARLYMFHECLHAAAASLRAHALRSGLSMLGISIGVAAVIAVVMLVQGLSQTVLREFQGLGGGTFTLRAQSSDDRPRGRLSVSDFEQIRHRIEGVRDITPVAVLTGRVSSEVRNGVYAAGGLMLGATESYQDVHRTYPVRGRFLTQEDDQTRRRVVVLGERLRRSLRLPDDPIGRYVQIAGEWFKVVGLMEPRGEMFGESQDNYLVMPFHTAMAIGGTDQAPELVVGFTVKDMDEADAVKARVGALLRQLHGLAPNQPDDFMLETAESLQRSVDEIVATVTLVVAGVVGVSLLVGGVGIMNVMLMSVTERTREIGIAKALGAPRAYIMVQFLIEAVLLALAGGVVGILLGFMLGLAVGRLMPGVMEPVLPWWAVAGATVFSGAVGVVFGLLPARNAANLVPIEALRHE